MALGPVRSGVPLFGGRRPGDEDLEPLWPADEEPEPGSSDE